MFCFRECGFWFWCGVIGIMLVVVIGLFLVVVFNLVLVFDLESVCWMDCKDFVYMIILIDQLDLFSENDFVWVDELIDGEVCILLCFGCLIVVFLNSIMLFDLMMFYLYCFLGSVEDVNLILQNLCMIDDIWCE